jgi:hypothetical protein
MFFCCSFIYYHIWLCCIKNTMMYSDHDVICTRMLLFFTSITSNDVSSDVINVHLKIRYHVFLQIIVQNEKYASFAKNHHFWENQRKVKFPRECSYFKFFLFIFVIEIFFCERLNSRFQKCTIIFCAFLKS